MRFLQSEISVALQRSILFYRCNIWYAFLYGGGKYCWAVGFCAAEVYVKNEKVVLMGK